MKKFSLLLSGLGLISLFNYTTVIAADKTEVQEPMYAAVDESDPSSNVSVSTKMQSTVQDVQEDTPDNESFVAPSASDDEGVDGAKNSASGINDSDDEANYH